MPRHGPIPPPFPIRLKNPLRAENAELKTQIAELESQIDEEKSRSKQIDKLEEYVGTDEYIEDVAKDKLGLIHENEIIFRAQ